MAAKAESREREVKLLSARNDQYGGVIVDINGDEPMDPATFLLSLTSSIAHWKLQGKKGVWIKLPIERVNLVEAAVKIDSEFVEVLAFRQSHKSFFQKSDLFFVCMLRPLSFDIQKQEQEIEAAKWMPFEEYAAQPFVQKYELLKYIHP
ncbi:unnamed protein product [Prunus brigantina]